MTPVEFREARRKLGLSSARLGEIIGVEARQVRRYEAPAGASSHRPVPPFLAVLMRILVDSAQARKIAGIS